MDDSGKQQRTDQSLRGKPPDVRGLWGRFTKRRITQPPGDDAPRGKEAKRWSDQPLVWGGAVVLVFLGVLGLTLAARQQAPDDMMDDMQWPVVVALVATAPLSIPLFLRYIRPELTSLKFLSIIEIGFREAKSADTKGLAQQLSAIVPDRLQAATWAGSMTDHSSVIVDKAREMSGSREEIAVIDLHDGDRWLYPNLYFFALLLEHRTAVEQLVFMAQDSRGDRTFVGMCSPRDLQAHLAQTMPLLATAKQAVTPSPAGYPAVGVRYGALDPALGSSFFSALQTSLTSTPDAELYEQWVTPANLREMLGGALNTWPITWTGALSTEDYRRILASPTRYVPAVDGDHQYRTVIDQFRTALAVARGMVDITVA